MAAVTGDHHLGGWRQQRLSLTVLEAGSPASRGQGRALGKAPSSPPAPGGGWLPSHFLVRGYIPPTSACPSRAGGPAVCLSHGILPCECVFSPERIRTPVTWMQDPPCSSTTSPSLITSAKTLLPRGQGSGLQCAFQGDVIPPQHLRSKNRGLLLSQPPRLVPHLQPRPLLLRHSPLPMTRPVRPSASQESEAPTVAAPSLRRSPLPALSTSRVERCSRLYRERVLQ